MVVERDGVGGDVLLHAVLPRLVRVAPAPGRVGERRVLPGGDRRGGFMGLNSKRGSMIREWPAADGRQGPPSLFTSLVLVSLSSHRARHLRRPMVKKFLLQTHCRLRDPASLPQGRVHATHDKFSG